MDVQQIKTAKRDCTVSLAIMRFPVPDAWDQNQPTYSKLWYVSFPENYYLIFRVWLMLNEPMWKVRVTELIKKLSSDADCCVNCSNIYIVYVLIYGKLISDCDSKLFNRQNNSMPFNRYSFLTTHNSFAIKGERSHTGFPRVTIRNQEDTVTEQLNVRIITRVSLTLKELFG